MFKNPLTKTIEKVLSFKKELEDGIALNNQKMSNAIQEQERLDTVISEKEEENGTAYRLLANIYGNIN